MTSYVVFYWLIALVGILAAGRVWRASTLDGVLTLLVPFWFIVTTIKYWNDPDHNIRWHALILLAGIGILFGWRQRLGQDPASAETARQAMTRGAFDDGGAPGGLANDRGGAPEGPLTHAMRIADMAPEPPPTTSRSSASAPLQPSPPSASRATARARPEPDTPVTAAPARTPTRREAIAAATFQRGTLERQSLGFAIDVPAHFHALSAVDARRIEASLGGKPDPREVAWILHESVEVGTPGAWLVRVRWLDDGWTPATTPIDAESLLRNAQASTAATQRLAGSGGALVGFAVAPASEGDAVAWVEERVPDGATASVLDCHAVRQGAHGVLEFSVVGAAPGSHALCHASVRLLAGSARFSHGYEHTPAPAPALPRATYSLADLIAQSR